MIRYLLNIFGLVKKPVPAPMRKVYKSVSKGKVVAKMLFGYDIEYMYKTVDDDPGLCPVCHTALKKIPNPEYKMQKKKGDVFYTYDSFLVVTEKFKKFCETNEYLNLKFTPLPKSPGYYFFEARNIFKVDPKMSSFKFGKKHECCGEYEEITVETSLWKDKNFNTQTQDFISQTDYWFRYKNHKSPNIIIGVETAGKMKKYGISGIYFVNVMG
jgi:hypothetical protein